MEKFASKLGITFLGGGQKNSLRNCVLFTYPLLGGVIADGHVCHFHVRKSGIGGTTRSGMFCKKLGLILLAKRCIYRIYMSGHVYSVTLSPVILLHVEELLKSLCSHE